MHLAEYLPQLLLAWSIQAMGILSPGPSVALILGVATSRGRLPSVVTAFGVACGSEHACRHADDRRRVTGHQDPEGVAVPTL